MKVAPRDRVILKIVLIGDGAVGKTSLRYRFMGKNFKGNYTMTIGADLALKRINYKNGNYIAQVWDLAGQQTFSGVRKVYYQGAMGALLVFSVERKSSFLNMQKWIAELMDNVGKLVPMILIGNKSDLRDADSKYDFVPHETAIDYAHRLSEWSGFDIPYIETSALTGENIDKAFTDIVERIDKNMED